MGLSGHRGPRTERTYLMESANNTTCELSEDVCDDKCLNKIWGFWIEGVATSVISVFGILGGRRLNLREMSKGEKL